ncbi:MAG: SH3 domain-containing protein [Chloroflexi bacterium]|nr:SH3 domain-containing protein [Chloroflexota bacterium]
MHNAPKLSVVLGCLLLAASCGGGKPSPPPAEPTAPVTATITARATTRPSTPSADATIDVAPLRVGAPVPFPDNVALIIEVGCWQCDGDSGRLIRIYRDAAGVLQETPLIAGARPGGHTVSSDGSQIAYAWCSRGACDGFNPPSSDVQTTIGWSRDGGITSTAFAPLDGVYNVAAVVRGMLLATGQTADMRSLPMRSYPSGDTFTPPPGGDHPIATGWDQLAFLTADRSTILLGPDVESFDLGPGRQVNGIAPADVAGNRFAIDWSERVTETDVRSYKSIVSLTGPRLRIGIERTFLAEGSIGQSGGWLDPDTLIGTYEFHDADLPTHGAPVQGTGSRPLPATFDLKTGTIHPILEPFLSEAPYAHGRNFVLAVIRGPFARVVNTGSCLNLRSEPRPDASAKTCAADNVLLRLLGEEESAGDITWFLAAMPDGTDGWVSSKFVAR